MSRPLLEAIGLLVVLSALLAFTLLCLAEVS